MNEPSTTLPRRELDLAAVAGVLWAQRWIIVGFLLAAQMAAGIGSLLTTPLYQAVALVHLKPRAGSEVNVSEVVNNDQAGYLESRERARTQIQIMLSRSVRTEVVRRYRGLGHDDISDSSAAIDTFGKTIAASPREDTQLVEISVRHPDPERAAILANLVAKVYVESNLMARTDAARETRVWLSERSTTSRADLEAANQKVMDFKQAHQLEDIDERVDGISTRMTALQTALGDATAERVLLASKLGEHQRLLAKGQVDVLAGMFSDPALDTMLRERAKIVTETAEVLARYGSQHPEHQRAVEQIRRVEDLVAAEVRRNVDGEASRVKTLLQQEERLSAELTAVKVELLEKQRLKSEYAELDLELMRVQKTYGALGDRGDEVELQAQSQLNDVRVVDEAIAPQRPVTPNIPLNLAMASVVGLVGGAGLALLLGRANQTVDSAEHVEHELGVPLIGLVPTLPASGSEADRALYGFNHPRSQPAEAIRGIRAVLQSTPSRERGKCFVVTSCLPGEGKTHTAVGIASAFAQLGSTVLLVDADLRIPRLHTVFGVSASPGIADALVDIEDPFRFVHKTEIPRLHLLRGGSQVEFPNELLASAEFDRLMGRLRESYQVVIIDTAPVGLVSDALGLARQSDGVVVVVRRGMVPTVLARKTLAQLKQFEVTVLGVALNDVAPSKEYGRGYYDDRRRTDAAKQA